MKQKRNRIIAILLAIISIVGVMSAAFSDVASAAEPLYEVEYDANGGKGNMSNSTLNGDKILLKYCDFTRTGYSFAGWSTSKNGEVEYDEGNWFVPNESSPKNKTTLYAIWTPKKYTIEFSANDGKGSMDSVELEYDQEYTLPECEFERKGYSFLGWSNSVWNKVDYKAGTVVKNLQTEGYKPLYAAWKEDFYTVVLNSNNGLNQTKEYEASCASPKYIAEVDYQKTGYHIAGWSLTPNGEKKYDRRGEIDPITDKPGKVDLFVVWEPNTYTVKFDNNGGTGSMDPVVCKYDEPTKLPKCTFTKEGYVFGGWSNNLWPSLNNKEFDDEGEVLNLTAVNEGGYNLRAIWVEGSYTVRYHMNDGSDKTEDQTIKINNYHYLKKEFKRTGYTFLGWSDKPDGKVVYQGAQNVIDLAKMNETVDLYAVWKPNTYSVIYVGNGADNTPDLTRETLTYDQEHKLLKNEFYKPGYVFGGWSTKENFAPEYTDQEVVKNLSDQYNVTLYAFWKQIMRGDVDGDGKVTPADARTALRIAVALETYEKTSRQISAADIDRDGNITPADARSILRAAVQLEKI